MPRRSRRSSRPSLLAAVLGAALATVALAPPSAALHTPGDVSEERTATVPPAGSVTTDDELDGATAADPVETTVSNHVSGGVITIREGPQTRSAPAGFAHLGDQVDISVPDNPDYTGIGAQDNVYTFRLDSSLVAGRSPGDIAAFHHGTEVAVCPAPTGNMSGTFVVNPCVRERSVVGDDTELEIWHRSPGPSTPSFNFGARIGESVSTTLVAGGTATTDGEGDGATPADPVETSLTHPVGGPVTIEEVPITTAPPTGFSFLGLQVNITAPPATATTPVVITFVLDGTVLEGRPASDIGVFRNGAGPIGACAAGSSAAPDPCVASRTLSGDDLQLVVRTSAASAWNFAVAAASGAPAPASPAPSTVTLPDTAVAP